MLGVLGGESVVSMRSMEDIRASVRSIKFCEVSGHPISFTIEDTKFWMNKTQEKRAVSKALKRLSEVIGSF